MIRNVRQSVTAITRHVSTPLVPTCAVSTASSSRATPTPIEHISEARPRRDSYQNQKTRKFVSRHERAPEKRLLKPHVLSARLTKLCSEDKLNEAVNMLKNVPLDAQNTTVWNTLVHHVGRAGRYQLAYQLWTEVRCL